MGVAFLLPSQCHINVKLPTCEPLCLYSVGSRCRVRVVNRCTNGTRAEARAAPLRVERACFTLRAFAAFLCWTANGVLWVEDACSTQRLLCELYCVCAGREQTQWGVFAALDVPCTANRWCLGCEFFTKTNVGGLCVLFRPPCTLCDLQIAPSAETSSCLSLSRAVRFGVSKCSRPNYCKGSSTP